MEQNKESAIPQEANTVTPEQAQDVAAKALAEAKCEHCNSRLISQPELIGAVQYIHGSMNTARERIHKLTGVQAKRVLEAVMESPLEQQVKGFTTKDGSKAFNLITGIQSAKFVLFQGSRNQYDNIADDIEKEMKTEENGEASDINNSPQEKENKNG